LKIAYIISAYKLPRQLVRLVSRLQHPGRRFYIHVDANAQAGAYDAIADGLKAQANVELLPRHHCRWGDFGHVRATLTGIEHIVHSGSTPDYLVLLTGQDYPIKPNAFAESFLSRHAGRSFLNFRPLPVEGLEAGGYERLPDRPLPYGLQPYFGSGYWCLHEQALHYVVEFLRRHPAYISFFERVRVPDEMFFQTMLLNSPLAGTIVNDDLRLIKWPGPAVLTMNDWEEIREAPDLFARKFDEEADGRILDEIDRRIGADR
jgi:hypothetical protein